MSLLGSCGGDTTALYNPKSSGTIYCNNPVPLNGQYDPATPGYIFVFNNGTNVQTKVSRLDSIYDMQVKSIYESALLGFSADMSGDTREQLRCEASVQYIEYDALATTN